MTELTNILVRIESWKVVQWYRLSLCKFWFGSVYSRGGSPECKGVWQEALNSQKNLQ